MLRLACSDLMARSKRRLQPTEELAGVPSFRNSGGESAGVALSVTQGTNNESIDGSLGGGRRRRSIQLGSGSRRRSRGRTRMMYVWKKHSNRKMVIWANRFGQPIGPEAAKFTNFCGVVARNPHLCPLGYPNWSKVPTENKMAAFSTIKEHFIYPDDLKKWVNKSVCKKWRDYKSYLKGKFYLPDKSEAENTRDVPPRVMAQDWQYLVNYWKSEKGKKKAETNKRSRALQKMTHTTGSKSFARVRDELEEENGGEMVGEVDFYESTHLTKNGTFIDDEAANTLKKAKEMLAERASTASDPLNVQMEVMAEVRGTVYGHVRGLGLGPTPMQVFGSRPSSSCFARNDEVAELKAQVHELKELVATLIRQQNVNQGTPSQSRVQRSVSSRNTNQQRRPWNAASGESYSGESSHMR